MKIYAISNPMRVKKTKTVPLLTQEQCVQGSTYNARYQADKQAQQIAEDV